MNDIYRSFAPDLEVRSDGDGRTIAGIAVPYGQPMRIDATLVEQFAPGAFRHQIRAAHRIPYFRDHSLHGGKLIGKVSMLRDDAAGLYFEARISRTPAGDETLELARDRALPQVSIGFREVHNRRLPDGTVERTRADLREIASVLEGAYGDHAQVESVRALGDHGDELCAHCGSPLVVRHASDGDRLEQARQIAASLPILPA